MTLNKCSQIGNLSLGSVHHDSSVSESANHSSEVHDHEPSERSHYSHFTTNLCDITRCQLEIQIDVKSDEGQVHFYDFIHKTQQIVVAFGLCLIAEVIFSFASNKFTTLSSICRDNAYQFRFCYAFAHHIIVNKMLF